MEFLNSEGAERRAIIKKTAQEILNLLDGMNTKLARRALEIAIEELETNSTVSGALSNSTEVETLKKSLPQGVVVVRDRRHDK